MSDIPKDTLEQKPENKEKKGQAAGPNPDGPSTDFSTLINAIKSEGSAYRKEEQREDRGKRFREWVTIILIALTFSAICYQVYEMKKVYEPIREQAEASKMAADAATRQSEISVKALVQAQRAWVGPRNATFAAEPVIGKPVEIAIEYLNSGREPALGFIYSIEPLLFTAIDELNGTVGINISNAMNRCKDTKEWQGGSVIYPTSGFTSYTLNAKTKDDFVDEGLIKGDKNMAVQGCFLYQTFNIPRHSYFCYFYKQGLTKPSNLNICVSGHYAD